MVVDGTVHPCSPVVEAVASWALKSGFLLNPVSHEISASQANDRN